MQPWQHRRVAGSMVCDVCRRPCWGVTIFNAMSGRPSSQWVRACKECSDDAPCPSAEWDAGVMRCRHGRKWKPDAGKVLGQAYIAWDELPRSWWVRLLSWLGLSRCKPSK